MLLALTIFIYIIYLSDLYSSFTSDEADLLLTTPAMILISWYQNPTWGIVMCVVGVIFFILAILRSMYSNK